MTLGEIVNLQNVSLPKNNFPKCQPKHQMTEMLCGLYYKTFRIVIYDRNDSTIVDPVL
jgi:hypothetical protein